MTNKSLLADKSRIVFQTAHIIIRLHIQWEGLKDEVNSGCGNITMGQSLPDSNSDKINGELIEKLTQVLTEQSNNFPDLHIYRLNEKPYDYFMRFREVGVESEEFRAGVKRKIEMYNHLDGHRNIVRVEAAETKKVLELCSNSICFDSYAKYHNYTLEDAIKCKRARNKNFREVDLLYVLNCLTSVLSRFNKVCGDHYKGVFQSDRIYLSTEGYIKIYPFHLSYQPHQEIHLTLTPKHPLQNSIMPQNDDLHDIARIVARLILRKSLPEIDNQYEQIMEARISTRLASFLLRILKGKENVEWAKQELVRMQQDGTRAAYSICLEEDISLRESEIIKQQETDQSSQREQRQRRLLAIQPNLVASRIDCFYKRPSESHL